MDKTFEREQFVFISILKVNSNCRNKLNHGEHMLLLRKTEVQGEYEGHLFWSKRKTHFDKITTTSRPCGFPMTVAHSDDLWRPYNFCSPHLFSEETFTTCFLLLSSVTFTKLHSAMCHLSLSSHPTMRITSSHLYI